MTRPVTFLLSVLILVLIASAGCGGNGTSMLTNTSSNIGTRTLQSLTVTPASVDARNSPSGQVQFMATGNFTLAPMTVTSPAVRWSIGNPFATPTPAMSIAMSSQPSIDTNGLAQCNGFVGIATIVATAPVDPNASLAQMTAITPNVAGRASLICP